MSFYIMHSFKLCRQNNDKKTGKKSHLHVVCIVRAVSLAEGTKSKPEK
jgi:hypothetical protein